MRRLGLGLSAVFMERERAWGPSPSVVLAGLARVCLRCAQDTALEVEVEVAARVLALETEHKVRLALLQTELKEEMNFLKIENRNLQEKLQHEVGLREDLEKVSLARPRALNTACGHGVWWLSGWTLLVPSST